MTLSIGTRIDRYEVNGFIGAGAMGEVYRAHDSRLGRDVAIKVLPAAFSSDTERLRRFDQEARAVGALNHPNVVAVFDVGAHESAPFVVSELLRGDTLRARLADGPLPLRKAVEYAVQIARGLAAAHARNIVHRDLKPENLFLTQDGQLKILDFGLAKLVRRDQGSEGAVADSLIATAMTEMGRVMGTVGYMAPEQVRGESADHRADIFALGCVIFEMITGKQPFHRDSAVESMAAIVRDDLPAFPAEVTSRMPALVTLVQRCVEKQPGERFESARDLAYMLEALEESGSTGVPDAAGTGASASDVSYQRVTFRRGAIWAARFTPDGHSVVYSASWEGKPLEMFWAHIGNPEARSLGFPHADMLSISPSNEIAMLLRSQFVTSFDRRGTLARVPPMGGAARELLHDVHCADWTPDGTQLAIVRDKDAMTRLEYPIGNVLYKSAGWISQMRFSRDGNLIAFVDHPSPTSDSGRIAIVDRKGERRELTDMWGTVRGLAWSADGVEVWFSADRGGAARGLYAVTLEGRVRRVLQLASNLTLQDVTRDGKVLVGHGQERAGINGLLAGEARERDLSWLDWSLLQDFSPDGRTMLIDETAEGGGLKGSVYLRPMDGSPAIRLGDGAGRSFSPDGEWVISAPDALDGLSDMYLLPTGVGEPRKLESHGLSMHHARWTPDGKHLVVTGHEAGKGVRLYLLPLDGGVPQPFSPEGVDFQEYRVIRGGQAAIALTVDREYRIYPIAGGDSEAVPHLEPMDRLVRWFDAENAAIVYRLGEMPGALYRIDITTGERKLFRALTPPDPTGIYRIGRLQTSPDGSAHCYTYYMHLVDLHVIEGLK
jgi:serine/threonine protein kinase